MLIGVDWGTSRFRAYLMDGAGTVHDAIDAGKGLMQVPAGGYAAVLVEAIAPWRDQARGAPVLMSGMVGSRQGWVEAPYVPLPATLDHLAAATLGLDGLDGCDAAIVPGVAAGMDGTTFADVMRGEETEIFGALDQLAMTEGTFVLPGSHSKWVDVAGGAITGFRTAITGELFDAVSRHTILKAMLGEGPGAPAAFIRGVDAARELTAPGDLLARLFSIRAEGLFGRLAENDAREFLSGLLIGAEAVAFAKDRAEVVVVGAAELGERYRRALAVLGVRTVVAPKGAAANGLALIAARRGGAR